jgi:hypothetical protein
MGATYVSAYGSSSRFAWRIARGLAISRAAIRHGCTVIAWQQLSGSAYIRGRNRVSALLHCRPTPLARHVQQVRTSILRHPLGEPVVPYHTIAFSQQKLRAALRRAEGQDPAFTYGFVVHSRRQSERPSLGLITLHGESLAFNERLLKSLEGLPLWLFGHARITLVPGTSISPTEGGRTKQADRPLASMLMHIATFDTSTGVTQHLVQVEAVVKAESLVQPLLILAPTRPAAWPL